MRVMLTEDQHREARCLITELTDSKNPVTFLEGRGLLFRYELTELTGLNSTTVRKLAQGKKATKAQIAALKYALLHRAMNL